jgi:hypothetical protein
MRKVWREKYGLTVLIFKKTGKKKLKINDKKLKASLVVNARDESLIFCA